MRTLTMILMMTIPVAGQATKPKLLPQVTRGLERAVERGEARAIVVGLYDKGETTIVGFGQLSGDDDRKPQADTLFEIGSISKVFTSLLTEIQVAKGRLDWDDTLGDRFPDQSFASEAVAAITLRELSTHTAGLPRLPGNMDPSDPLDPYAGYERADLLAFLTELAPEQLDKSYEYSNLGAGLLGEIAADAAGLPYGEAMQRDVLAPLGMADSGVRMRDDQSDRIAVGFSAGADMPNWGGFDALAGAGALVSTVDDLLAFVRRNLEGGTLEAPLAAIRQAQNDTTAFGWHLHDIEGSDPAIWHNGGTGGYASFLSIRPDQGTAVIVLSTSTEYNTITELGFAQTTGVIAEQVRRDLTPYIGAYELAEGFVLAISERDGRLISQATGQGELPLTASADHEFVHPAAGVRIVFDIAGDQPASKLTLYQAGNVIPAPRVSDELGPKARTEIEVDAAKLADYVGKYRLTPAVTITVEARGAQLFAQLTGQAAYPVFAYEPDRFFYKIVDAQIQFERDEAGRVTAVVLHQGGEQRAPRIE